MHITRVEARHDEADGFADTISPPPRKAQISALIHFRRKIDIAAGAAITRAHCHCQHRDDDDDFRTGRYESPDMPMPSAYHKRGRHAISLQSAALAASIYTIFRALLGPF